VTKAGKFLIVSLASRRMPTVRHKTNFAAVRQAAAKECKDLLALAERHGGVAPPDGLVLLHI
jgi:hypothetical protein